MSKNIVLIGMPGSGKTTIGHMLEEATSLTYIDTDAWIEKEALMSISQIFQKYGEPHFRELESKAAVETGKMTSKIIATGGGMILKEKNMNALKENGVIFFLDRPMDHIFSDVDAEIRPLLKDNRAHLYNLYEERYPLYMEYCDYQILNDCPMDEVVQKIKNLWESRSVK